MPLQAAYARILVLGAIKNLWGTYIAADSPHLHWKINK